MGGGGRGITKAVPACRIALRLASIKTDLRLRLPGPRLPLRTLEQLIEVKLLCRVRVLAREGLVLLTPLLLLL